jgi:hypothetical protein
VFWAFVFALTFDLGGSTTTIGAACVFPETSTGVIGPEIVFVFLAFRLTVLALNILLVYLRARGLGGQKISILS